MQRDKFDRRLIQLVRDQPIIYDISHAKYLDTDHKNAIWDTIAIELRTNRNTCKKRWSNLRDLYRKALKKCKGQQQIRHKYAKELRFMKQYIEQTKSLFNTDDSISFRFLDTSSDNEEIKADIKGESDIDSQDQDTHDQNLQDQEYINTTSINRTDGQGFEAATSTSSVTVAHEINHEVDAFLGSIAPVLKRLPPNLWHFAKGEIFAVTQKYEYNMVMGTITEPQPLDEPS